MKLKEHSIVTLLKTFSKSEIDNLEKFISSPFFNSNKNITAFFSEIAKLHPDFEGDDFEKEKVYSKVYKDKSYNDSNYRWIMSKLTMLVEKYLMQVEFEKDKLMKSLYLISNHFQHHRADHLGKAISANEKLLSEYTDKDYIFFFHKYIHHTNEMNFKLVFKSSIKTNDLDFLYNKFLEATVAYINHFITGIAYDYLNAGIIFSFYKKNGVNKKINEIIKILNFAKAADAIYDVNADKDVLKALVTILEMYLYFEDISYYNNFINFLTENANTISKSQGSSYYSKLISYCRLKIVNHIEEEYFRKELFKICEIFLDSGYYKEEKTKSLTPSLFRIILENALELENFKYAENFIKRFSAEIIKEQRDNSYNYGNALINFYKEDYKSALDYLSKISGNLFTLDQKALRILLFVKQNYFFEGNNELNSFKKFLSANKFISVETQTRWISFCKLTKFYIEINEKKKQPGKKLIRDILNSNKEAYYHNWFLKKLNGL